MPGDTVKVDQEARDSSQKFRSIVDSNLTQALSDLRVAGDILADPNHWAGPRATEFGQIWNDVKGNLQRAVDGLRELQQNADRVLQEITQAGGG